VAEAQVGVLSDYFKMRGAQILESEIGRVTTTADAVAELKRVLPFPRWCGSNWDSVADAFEEVREALQMPAVLLVRGLPALLAEHQHLSLEFVIRIAELAASFSRSGDQFVVVYAAPSWT
jgi:hypothetical protein